MAGLKLNTDRTVTETFARGFARDLPRHALPAGTVHDTQDFLFDRPGMVYKRGGFSAHSAALGANARLVGIIDPPDRIVAVDANNDLFEVTSENAPQATLLGNVGHPTTENPSYYNGRLILTDQNAQFSGLGEPPKKVQFVDPNVVLSPLGGSPPIAFRSCVHASRLVLARNYANPNRLWFSPLPDIEATWDTATAYLDTTWEVTGLASTQGVLLVFSAKAIERVLGDRPPEASVTTDNMILQPVANIGCSDARSIVAIDSGVVFANPSGVYVTNSAGIQSLTEKPDGTGIAMYWRSLFPQLGNRGIACGILAHDYLKVDVFDDNYASVESLLCYLPSFTWMRISNLCGVSYATGDSVNNNPVEELYVAQGNKPSTLRLSSMLTPGAAFKSDPDGKPVLPRLRTRSFEGSPWLKAWGHGGINLDMEDAYADDPFLTVTAYKGFGDGKPKKLPDNPLRDSYGYRRQHLNVNTDSPTVALEIAQTNPSARTEITTIDLDVRDYPSAAARLE